MSRDDKTRINRVITRTGDRGETGLADGTRISKAHPRINVLGELDELNSALGVLRARDLAADLDTVLGMVQQRLFDIGGELAVPDRQVTDDHDLVELESQADTINAELPPLKEFVLPGGHPGCRLVHTTAAPSPGGWNARWWPCMPAPTTPSTQSAWPWSIVCPTCLFVMARLINQRHEHPETLWQPKG